jgi:hypothetical protein
VTNSEKLAALIEKILACNQSESLCLAIAMFLGRSPIKGSSMHQHCRMGLSASAMLRGPQREFPKRDTKKLTLIISHC